MKRYSYPAHPGGELDTYVVPIHVPIMYAMEVTDKMYAHAIKYNGELGRSGLRTVERSRWRPSPSRFCVAEMNVL